MMYYRGIGGLGRCFDSGLGYMHSGLGFLMMAGALIVAALVIALVVVLVKKARGNSMNRESLELLNGRFVRGEISEEDYIKMKKALRGK